MTDDRWAALTTEQQAFLLKLGRAPWRWFVSDARYAATWARMERENIRAAAEQEVTRQRSYYAILTRVTGYTGPDYRVKLNGQRTWIRATERQYEQAAQTGVQRSIGIPELQPLQITA
jgi:hypothetical protein